MQSLRTIVAFLLVGTVINATVAIAFACLGKTDYQGMRLGSRADADPRLQIGPQYGNVVTHTSRSRGITDECFIVFGDLLYGEKVTPELGFQAASLNIADRPVLPEGTDVFRRQSAAEWNDAASGKHRHRGFFFAARRRAGWPLRALRGYVSLEDEVGNQHLAMLDGHADRTAFIWRRTTGSTTMTRLIPYGIEPIGFAANTVFYAAALWISVMAAVMTPRALRRRRGHCDGCGYDLRATKERRCPECGHRPPVG